jgi:hypothetical protein
LKQNIHLKSSVLSVPAFGLYFSNVDWVIPLEDTRGLGFALSVLEVVVFLEGLRVFLEAFVELLELLLGVVELGV